MKKTFTYVDFANTVKAIVNGEMEITDEIRAAVTEKADALLAVQAKKAEYTANNKGKRTPKGASAETLERAEKIADALTNDFQTAAEIAAKIGLDLTALQISNAMKYVPVEVEKGKVVRQTVNSKGLTAEKEYTAYRKA